MITLLFELGVLLLMVVTTAFRGVAVEASGVEAVAVETGVAVAVADAFVGVAVGVVGVVGTVTALTRSIISALLLEEPKSFFAVPLGCNDEEEVDGDGFACNFVNSA